MKLYVSTILLFFLPAALYAQLSRDLDEVVVEARRPLSDTGVQKLAIDSTALKENISLSMADVIGYNSSVFVKTSGRATLSTVAFRGTAPSHTAVEWNGLPVNSPALGMTDFSMIPAYLIDRASLLYGASSLTRTAGGMGGLVDLSTAAADIPDGVSAQYVQGAGSFATFDEFLRTAYGGDRWKASLKAVYSSSKNDFSFVNRDKMENIYDEDKNIIGRYHPKERNRNGAYHDLHLLGQLYFSPDSRNTFGLNVWYLNSNREIPYTTTDYSNAPRENRKRENTLRAVASWDYIKSPLRTSFKAGYTHSWLAYDYGLMLPGEVMRYITSSRTYINSFYLKGNADYNIARGLILSAALSATTDHVDTADKASIKDNQGYNKHRTDVDASLAVKWQANERLGLSALVRQQLIGSKLSPVTPAIFADFVIYKPVNLMAKASVARNFKSPTLNDLYYIPGGNPDLDNEHGFTYDVGLETRAKVSRTMLSAGVTWFDSRIDDWIIWLPANKGFFSPRNLRSVHSYGLEADAAMGLKPFRDASLDLHGSFSWTTSVNDGKPLSEHDSSVGKQLPYVPKYSASATVAFSWRTWSLLYKWCYYSKRYTMSASDTSLAGSLPHYFMSNVAAEKRFAWRLADFSVKLSVNNLFDEEYQTVKSHPMPGINFEVFLSLTPKFL